MTGLLHVHFFSGALGVGCSMDVLLPQPAAALGEIVHVLVARAGEWVVGRSVGPVGAGDEHVRAGEQGVRRGPPAAQGCE